MRHLYWAQLDMGTTYNLYCFSYIIFILFCYCRCLQRTVWLLGRPLVSPKWTWRSSFSLPSCCTRYVDSQPSGCESCSSTRTCTVFYTYYLVKAIGCGQFLSPGRRSRDQLLGLMRSCSSLVPRPPPAFNRGLALRRKKLGSLGTRLLLF